jgi:uncharacterized protein (TIGR02246 family)
MASINPGVAMKKVLAAAATMTVVAFLPAISCAEDAGLRAAIDSLNQAFATAWNAHDSGKMADVWSHADMVNPFGMQAHGRAEIAKLFATEQSGVMRASTFTIESNSIRQISPDIAVQDLSIVITGMLDPDGRALPTLHPHSFEVLVRKGGHWRVEYVRAYVLQPTTAAPK